MARLTIEVETVKESANKALSDPTLHHWQEKTHGVEGAKAYRAGIAACIESVLHASGNYHGFRFTDGQRGALDESKRAYY